MDFDTFVRDGRVILGEKDLQKAKALVKIAENNIKFAGTLKVNEISASPAFVLSYEALREILEAICLVKGYKVYSHEAFTFYLRKIGENNIAEHFDRFRKLRNGVNYYGKAIPVDIAVDSIKRIKSMCLDLKDRYLVDL